MWNPLISRAVGNKVKHSHVLWCYGWRADGALSSTAVRGGGHGSTHGRTQDRRNDVWSMLDVAHDAPSSSNTLAPVYVHGDDASMCLHPALKIKG